MNKFKYTSELDKKLNAWVEKHSIAQFFRKELDAKTSSHTEYMGVERYYCFAITSSLLYVTIEGFKKIVKKHRTNIEQITGGLEIISYIENNDHFIDNLKEFRDGTFHYIYDERQIGQYLNNKQKKIFSTPEEAYKIGELFDLFSTFVYNWHKVAGHPLAA